MAQFEQVPQYSVTQLDDGLEEKLQIVVRLPGISSVSEFTVRVQSNSMKLHAPGRYFLELPLDAVVEEKPEQLKFVRKRNEFKAVLKVVGPPRALHTSVEPPASSEAAKAVPKLSVHESFLADAAKLRDTGRKAKTQAAKNKKQVEQTPKAEPSSPLGTADYVEWQRPTRRGRKPQTEPLASSFSSHQTEHAEKEDFPQANGYSIKSEGIFAEGIQEPPRNPFTDWKPPSVIEEVSLPQQSGKEDTEQSTGFRLGPQNAQHETAAEEKQPEVQTSPTDQGGMTEAARREMLDMDTVRDSLLKLLHEGRDVEEMLNLLKTANGQQEEHWRESKGVEEAAASSQASPETRDQPGKGSDKDDGASRAGPSPSPLESASKGDKGHDRSKSRPQSSAGSEATNVRPASADPGGPPSPSHNSNAHQKKSKKQSAEKKPAKGKQKMQAEQREGSSQQATSARSSQKNSADAPAPSTSSFGSPEWFQEQKAAMADKEILGQGFTWVLLCAAFLLMRIPKSCYKPLRWVAAVAPDFLLSTLGFFRCFRLQRYLMAQQRNSLAIRVSIAAVSCIGTGIAGYWLLYIGICLLYFSWATVFLALDATLAIVDFALKTAFSLLRLFLWRPNFWTSTVFAVAMRYAWLPGDGRKAAFFIYCFWGWPLMIASLRGGFLGLLTLPFCFFATIWGISQLHPILACDFCVRCFSYFGWSWGRPVSLVLGALYMLLLAPLSYTKDVSKPASKSVEVPEGADGEVARVLQAGNLYEVLMVPRDVDAETLRRAKRTMALATHPDKLSQAAGSNAAFARVTEAFDVLSDPNKRIAYDKELRVQAYLEEMQFQADEAGSTTQSFEEPTGITFMCPSCGMDHKGVFVDRTLEKARYCGECQTYHAAKDGEGWHESSYGLLGRKVKMFVCLNEKVLDMTEWADCALKLSRNSATVAVNKHKVSYSFGADLGEGGGSAPGSAKGKKGKKGRKR